MQKQKTKIAIVGPYPLDPSKVSGGIQAVICTLVKSLKSFSDLEIHIITVDFDQDLELVKDDDVYVHVLKSSKRKSQLTLYNKEIRWIAKRIRQIEPHLVHVHGTDMYGFAVRKLTYPTLLTVHGILRKEAKIANPNVGSVNGLFQRTKGLFNAYFEKHTLRHVNHIVIISPYVQEMINGATSSEMYLIDNPVDDTFFRLQNKEFENRLLFVGMIRARKGILNLLRSINDVRESFPNIRLHIIGKVLEPDYNNTLHKYIRENNLHEYVVLKGRIGEDELYREFEQCSMLILPSEEESSPMVIEQAMAVGKPVIASNVGGIPYLIRDGESGFLVEYDDIEALTKKISFLLKYPEERTNMGVKAKKEACERFKPSAIATKTYDLYLNIINANGVETG